MKVINIGEIEMLVDDEDYPLLSKISWRVRKQNGRIDVCATVRPGDLILDRFKGMVIDHKNGKTLDFRRDNIRVCTQSQNLMNQRSRMGTSKYKGVCRQKNNRWSAQIGLNGKSKWLGSFSTEEEAARRYDGEAVKLFGEFARLNFSDG